MSAPTRRADAGSAVAGLFARQSATGGLADPDSAALAGGHAQSEATSTTAAPAQSTLSAGARPSTGRRREPRMRLGVELTEREIAFLRSLSRPANTGGPRTLGAKFVATGVLAAAIEVLREGPVDMQGVSAGDVDEMKARARAALLRAGQRRHA